MPEHLLRLLGRRVPWQVAVSTGRARRDAARVRRRLPYGVVLTVCLTIALPAADADAFSFIRNNFFTAYPDSVGTALSDLPSNASHCGLCHYNFNGGGPRNPYGAAIERTNFSAGAILGLGSSDSDGDGFTNDEEITELVLYSNTPTFPGLTDSNVNLTANVASADLEGRLTPILLTTSTNTTVTTVTVTTTSTVTPVPVSCGAAPEPVCLEAAQAKLQYSEKSVGKEKMKLQWKNVSSTTTQGDFGDPVDGLTSVALCIYDDANVLVQDFIVDRAGQTCAGKPCWSAKGTKGYGYKDKETIADGISKIGYSAGVAGKGKADGAGKNNAAKGQTVLPTGVVAALSGNGNPTIQLLTSDGLCIGATISNVTKDDGVQYQAQKK